MPDVTRLHLAYRARLDRLRRTTVAVALRADDPEAAVQLVLEAQRSAVANVDAYMSLEAGLATDTATEPWGLDPEQLIGQAARRGRALEDVYGANWISDVGSFAGRISREVNTDISLADRAGGFVHTEGDSRIVGTRRVLGAGPNCGLCVAAATRHYRKRDLRPMHHHCGCTTSPIYADTADGWNKPTNDMLRSLYARAGSTDAKSLGRITVTEAEVPAGVDLERLPAAEIVDSPEVGPTLIAI